MSLFYKIVDAVSQVIVDEVASPNHSEAYKKGNKAYKNGANIDMCPYPVGSAGYEEWRKGFYGR